jgi:hypothetical protein
MSGRKTESQRAQYRTLARRSRPRMSQPAAEMDLNNLPIDLESFDLGPLECVRQGRDSAGLLRLPPSGFLLAGLWPL